MPSSLPLKETPLIRAQTQQLEKIYPDYFCALRNYVRRYIPSLRSDKDILILIAIFVNDINNKS